MIKKLKKWAVGLAGEYAKDYCTVDNITTWLLDLVNKLLDKAIGGVDAEKMASICNTCANVSTLCNTLSKALADKKIAQEEAEQILKDVKAIIGTCGITDAKLAAYIEMAVAKIQERI